MLAAAQASLERQRRAADEALAAAEEQHRAQARRLGQEQDADRKGQAEALSRLRADLAQRTQTLLGLQVRGAGAVLLPWLLGSALASAICIDS